MGPLKILLLEDSETDAEIVNRLLKKEIPELDFRLCMTKKTYIDALETFKPDVILSDNSMPQFDATEALNIANHLALQIPFILVTGTVSEEFAVDIIKRGADDYVLKDRLARLPSAIDTALKNRRAEKEKTEAMQQLIASEAKYRTLVEQAFDGIIIYSLDGQILDCNYSACSNTGYTQEELKKLTVFDLFFEEELKERPIYFKTLKAGLSTLDYRRLKRKDGSYAEMEIGTRMTPDGNLMAIGRDITERKKAEAILNEERDKFAKIAATSPGLIYSFRKKADGSFSFPYTSSAVEGLFGFRHEEITHDANKVFALSNPEDLDRVLESIAVSATTMQPWKAEFRYRHPQKGEIWLEGNSIPMAEPGGSIIWHGIVTDITERKNSEQKIIQSELNLTTIFENTSEGFVLTDAAGIIIAFNEIAKKSVFINMNGEIQPGSNIFDLVEETRMDFFKKTIEKVMQGESVQYDRLFKRNSGKITWINFSINPVSKDNVINGFCITGRDITEKKMAEQEKEFTHNNLYALINNTNDIIWSVDKNFNLITSNQAFDNIIKAISGKKIKKGECIFSDGVSDDEQQRFSSYYKRAFAGETFSVTEYFENPYEFWSEISFYPIYEEESVIGTACFSRDITERKKAEEELKNNFFEKGVLAERMSTILNTLPANIALLDNEGAIIDVNDSWKIFADGNGFTGGSYGIGDNYIHIAEKAFAEEESDGRKVAAGIIAVLGNKVKEFMFEYPCHSPRVKRWFRMVATPINEKENRGAVIMHIDISELRRLEEERMQSKTAEQKNITQAMILGQEKERNAIGRELHDNLNQILAGINLLLGMLKTKPERLEQYLPLCIEHINLAIHENRKIAHELVSPNQLSETLVSQVDKICRNMLQTAGLATNISHDHFDEGLLSDDQKLAVYRVVQEQCSNIIKYAQAGNVEFILSTTGQLLQLKIKDDGLGMKKDKSSDGIGLQNMMSRVSVLNGTLKIDTKPGSGFLLHVEIPL